MAEQRKKIRFKAYQTATVTVLGMMPGPILLARILDMSGSGMRLRSLLPVPCGVPIKIEMNHTLARGSVCSCEPGSGSYELGVQVLETAPL